MNKNQITCPNCQAELPENAKFCGKCGTIIDDMIDNSSAPAEKPEQQTQKQEGKVICPRCQQPAYTSEKYCQTCGYPLEELPAEEAHQSSPDSKKIEEKSPQTKPDQGQLIKPIIQKKRTRNIKTLRGNKRINFKSIVIMIAIIGIGIGGFFTFKWWRSRASEVTYFEEIEACKPESPGDNFVLSNKIDLQGELNKDYYFAGGEEYLIAENSSLVIPEGKTLLIEPGARIRFGEGSRLVINGTLLACGRTNRRILFTADTSSGRPGFWFGIEFNHADDESVLGHVTIEYAGKEQHSPIWLENTDLHIEDVEFNTNNWYAVSFNPDSFPKFRSPIIVENGLKGWEIRSGQMTKDRTWYSDDSLIVNGPLEITTNTKLTIAPGTILKYLPASYFRVSGELDAKGLQDQPIVMTSVNDSEEEGTLSPAAGDWGGVQIIGEESNAQLDFVKILYAGNSQIQPACIYMENSDPILNNISIADCQSFALSTDIMSEPIVEELNLPGIEAVEAWELRSSNLEKNHSRKLSNIRLSDGETSISPVVTGWVRILEQAELMITPDTVLLFKNGKNSGLVSEGRLTISGTEDAPVVFTSWRDKDFGGTQGASLGDWGGLVLNNHQVNTTQINYLDISYGGAEETNCLILSNAYPEIDHLEIENCFGAPINSDAASAPIFTNLLINNNEDANIYEIRESSLEENREYTWNALQTPDGEKIIHRITGQIHIKPDASLSIDPGMIFQFSKKGSLYVQGGFNATGDPENNIVFTSQFDQENNSQPGDWSGVILEGDQSFQVLENVKISYAGSFDNRSACLILSTSAARIKNVQISNCAYYPISSDIASKPEVGNLKLTDNYPADEWEIRESKLAAGNETTWDMLPGIDEQDQIYRVITGWISIEDNAKLNINSGAILKFAQGKGLYSEGTLSILGSPEKMVIFTSWRDPDYSNETGGQAGDWGGLILNNARSDTIIQHLKINYSGGPNNYNQGSLALIQSSPTIQNLTVIDGSWYPISLDMNSDPILENITLLDNSPGNEVEIRSSHLSVQGEKVFDYWTDSQDQQIIRIVTGEIIVDETSSLLINPNITLLFTQDGKLVSNGGLNIKDAVLTSVNDEAYHNAGISSGQRVWHGIEINGRQTTQLNNTTIRYANIGLLINNAAPQLSNVQIEYSNSAAFKADLLSDLNGFTNISLDQNALNGILFEDGVLPGGENIWPILNNNEDQIIRIFNQNLVVGTDSTLTIEPGVILKFLPQAGLVVEGKLITDLQAEAPVIFTSVTDDNFGGDTDNLNEIPRRGSWIGIDLNPNSTEAEINLHHVYIFYANVGLRATNLENWQYSDLLIQNSLELGLSCDESIEFDNENTQIALVENGILTDSCPTPDR